MGDSPVRPLLATGALRHGHQAAGPVLPADNGETELLALLGLKLKREMVFSLSFGFDSLIANLEKHRE